MQKQLGLCIKLALLLAKLIKSLRKLIKWKNEQNIFIIFKDYKFSLFTTTRY